MDAVRRLIGGDGDGTGDAPHAVVVTGPPACGKTEFGLRATLEGIGRFGDGRVSMVVSGRQAADRLSDRVIRARGTSSGARPVTTLSAIAFRMVGAERKAADRPQPKLLNGAEQDALLRAVVGVHIAHAQAGELCGTCELLRRYFASRDWAQTIYGERSDDGGAAARTTSQGIGGSDVLFARGIDDTLVMQLRDMLARMDELGLDAGRESAALEALGEAEHHTQRTERLGVQWRLAFALRGEYAAMVARSYPDEFRLDSSRLLVEGARAVGSVGAESLPALVVADDFQDLTLAGLAFLEALAARGTRLALIGNPDEAVQTFRGSYPEYLFARARQAPISAVAVELDAWSGGDDADDADDDNDANNTATFNKDAGHSYLDLVASRVSLSIASERDTDVPVAQRPGKLPALDGALPIAPLDAASPTLRDGSVGTALYRSEREELDDIVFRIKRAHLVQGVPWNDMAVIAHDNDVVRAFGERLRGDGVPVRYSAVTKPLKDDPSVQGLFALVELAQLRRRGAAARSDDPVRLARFVRSRARELMESPLVAARSKRGGETPARFDPVDSIMRAIASLSRVMDEGRDGGSGETGLNGGATGDAASSEETLDVDVTATLPQLRERWRGMREGFDTEPDGEVGVDDSIVDPAAGRPMPFGVEAMYVMLALGGQEDGNANTRQAVDDGKDDRENVDAAAAGSDDPAQMILRMIDQVGGGSPSARAFAHVWALVGQVAGKLGSLPADEPQYALGLAWDACDVARGWQVRALANTAEGRAANDRLDVMMRLFAYAAGSGAKQSVADFIAGVRSMRIEADSLAKVAPIDQAVTLTTPAGSAGGHWPMVAIVRMQQDVWPNLKPRNTLFGGEDLAAMVLDGGLDDDWEKAVTGRDPELARVLGAEQKSFLVALTRAGSKLLVSAVLSDDTAPSDFLYIYMPERFDRDPESVRYAVLEGADRYSGLDADPRGIVTAARAELMRDSQEPEGSAHVDQAGVRDAATSLALLADSGLDVADPGQWPYMGAIAHTGRRDGSQTDTGKTTGAASKSDMNATASSDRPTVTLSPSQVDRIWACPVCWMLESEFAGPRPSSAATSFGSIIHEVACRASELGLDAADFMQGHDDTERIEAIRTRMMDLYHALAGDPAEIADPEQRYQAERKDEGAGHALGDIATYFVLSNEQGYPHGNTKNFTVGRLEQAQCESSFAAMFGLDDVLEAYNAIDSVTPISRGELAAIMGALNGGWPEGMREDLRIRLTGRIDRAEWRVGGNGNERLRLIDWKTGHKHGPKQVFNDLQLVCYQLGVAFPEAERHAAGNSDEERSQQLRGTAERAGLHGLEALAGMPDIAQSALFDVDEATAPAQSGGDESTFQPPLFAGGHLNDTAFTPRSYYRDSAKLTDIPELPSEAPQEVGARAWSEFVALRGTQAVWALTMIARIFYTAAASRSERIVARPQADHLAHCHMSAVCPACAGEVDTVYEVRKG
ncbi:PD-(D/E)XK nuclease family protein [Bifidobacterium sp. ESL0763]|uniref:PD-(D/E)XK nuclease family protein n=1 Tax=Bifidobacterium sp. ESL0763 TaxID=2983227 RepID=UPI0023F618BD|nr:PD-(D/E)XK nuclease family protein [Bifidobacterium sp. ESL0763]MDF7664278.1 PD-(D/E)XK nuclease family protein [Bifidobacterium sp. ESL0763]